MPEPNPPRVLFDPARGVMPNLLNSVNMFVSREGACPGWDHGEMSGSADYLHYFVAGGETKNPSGNPRNWVACNFSVRYFEGGTLTLDETFEDVIQSLLVFDATASSVNTARMMAYFGSGTAIGASGGHAWRTLAADSGGGFNGPGTNQGWTKHTGATAVQAYVSARAGSKALLNTGNAGAGRTGGVGDHFTGLIVAGLYDGTTSNIGPPEPVGMGDWIVIKLASYLGRFVAGKGTGAYFRNNIDLEWQALQEYVEKHPHGLNTKAMAAVQNGVIIPMNDGSLLKWDFRVLHDQTPYRITPKPKDSEKGRIVFVTEASGGRLAVGRAPFQPVIDGPTAARMGFRFFTRIAGTYAEITSGVTDGDLATPVSANMNAWGDTATDRVIAVGPVPLRALVPYVTRNPNGNTQYMASPKHASAVGDGTVAGATYSSLGNLIDQSILSVANRSLVITGFPPAAAEPVWAWDSKTAYWDQVPLSLTMTGIDGGAAITGYWHTLEPGDQGGASPGMSSSTTIDEMGIVENRPGLKLADTVGPFTAANNFTSLAASSALTDVLYGEPRGEDYDWAIPISIFSKGGEFVAQHTSGTTGALSNGGEALLVFGRGAQFIIANGQREPRHTPYPRLCQWTTTEHGPKLTINNIRKWLDNYAKPELPIRITEFRVDTEDVPEADQQQLWMDCLDGRPAWKYGDGKGTNPITIKNDNAGYFYDAHLHYLYHDAAQTDADAPLSQRITAVKWEYGDPSKVRNINAPTVRLA